MKIAIKILPHSQGLDLPSYATIGSAGADLRAAVGTPLVIQPGERALVPTGIAMALPANYEGQVRPRSGLAVKFGLTVLNAPGTIDADYRGEIMVPLINLGGEEFVVEHGLRIAQLVVAPFHQADFHVVDDLDDTARGDGGFGSTGLS